MIDAPLQEAFICDYVRTPIGRFGGALSSVRTDDLGAVPLRALRERHDLDWAECGEVAYGCANQAGEDNRNVARMCTLLAGLPETVPGVTLNRLCGSGMDAVLYVARAIQVGAIEFGLAGGVESMSRAPFVMPKAASAFSRNAEIYDTTIGWRFVNPVLKKQYGVDSMPETGENVAADENVSRADQDAFAVRSQEKAVAAQENGRLAKEIVPVTIPQRKGDDIVVDTDEHPRAGTTVEKLTKLPTPFRENGTVTAGNASGVNDGAAALLIANEATVKRYGLTPIARVVAGATAGVAPRIMGMGPQVATEKLMATHRLRHGRLRCDRAERGVRRAGPARPAAPRGRRRRPAGQPQRRSHRARPSAGRVGCAHHRHGSAGDEPERRPQGTRHHVHRRRAGHRRRTCGRVTRPRPRMAIGAKPPVRFNFLLARFP